jgi:hypothetical protein
MNHAILRPFRPVFDEGCWSSTRQPDISHTRQLDNHSGAHSQDGIDNLFCRLRINTSDYGPPLELIGNRNQSLQIHP